MPSAQFTWKSFTDRMGDVDPDLRQMALFDLNQELLKESFGLKDEEQMRVLDNLLNCFGPNEKHSEVHSNAVRLLPALVPKLGENNRVKLVTKLVQAMVGSQPATVKADQLRQIRENACMGLKAITECLTPADAKTAQAAFDPLVQAFRTDDVKVRMDTFDVVTDLLEHFGKIEAIAAHHGALQDFCFKEFDGNNNSSRKKSVNCLAQLCLHTNDELFEKAVNHTIDGLKANKGEKLRRFIQLCNSISRTAASRFGSSVSHVVPFFFRELDRLDGLDDEDRESVEADEVRENILQALDSFVARCPTFVGPMLPDVVKYCGQLVKWDPNYCDDEEGEFDDEDEEDIDDDSDVSWKVRKSAARCLVEAIKSRPDELQMFIGALCSEENPLLPARFRERVENVRLEVLEVFQALLDASKISIPSDQREEGSFAISSTFAGGSFRMVVESRPECRKMLPLKESIVKSLLGCVKHKSPKVKLSSFTLLRDLFILIGNDLATAIPDCFAAAVQNLSDKRMALPQLRPEVLNFVRLITSVTVRLLNQDDKYENLLTHVEASFPVVFACSEDRFFKTVVASLRVCNEFVAAVRSSAKHEELAKALFASVFARMSTGDADQEVKRAAIDTMASILRFLEGSLKSIASDVSKAHEQLLVLLKSDTTRLAASRAILATARCEINSSLIKQYAAELTTLLRKTDRQVRESGIRTLTALVPLYINAIDASTFAAIVEELCNESTALLNDKELFLTSLGLQLAQRVVAAPGQSGAIIDRVVPRTLKLLSSPLVQGQPVRDAADLFAAVATSTDVPFASLLAKVMTAAKEANASTIQNVAAVVGVTVAADPDAKRKATTVADLCKIAKGSEDQMVVGLTCLGEVGRNTDLMAISGAVDTIKAALNSGKEEAKAAASSALGRAASSASGKALLTDIMAQVRSDAGNRYFLLRAVREAIATAASETRSQSPLRSADTRQQLVGLLLEFAGSTEEGIPDIVGECLGRYAVTDVNDMVPKYAAALGSANDQARASIIAAIKFTISGMNKNKASDSKAIQDNIDVFLSNLNKSQPLAVRRAALQLFATVAYAKPNVVIGDRLASTYIPGLLAELPIDTSLVKEVDLGPFKHRVDSGLETRKIAYECLSTLVDGIKRPNSILASFNNYGTIVEALSKAVYTPEVDIDIHNITRSMLGRLAQIHAGASAIAANLDSIGKSLETAAGAKAKDGQEPEKVAEGQKYAIVCILALNGVPGAPQNAAYAAALKKAQGHALFKSASAIAAAE